MRAEEEAKARSLNSKGREARKKEWKMQVLELNGKLEAQARETEHRSGYRPDYVLWNCGGPDNGLGAPTLIGAFLSAFVYRSFTNFIESTAAR